MFDGTCIRVLRNDRDVHVGKGKESNSILLGIIEQ